MEMNGLNFEEAKATEQQTPVPSSLSMRVDLAIKHARRRKKRGRQWTTAFVSAAVLMLTFVTSINASPAFAASVKEIPILGSFVELVASKTIRETKEWSETEVYVPKVEGLADEQFQAKLNAMIQERMEAHIARGQKNADELMQARIDTGTDPTLISKVKVFADYERYYADENYLSFSIFMYDETAPSYLERYLYTIDVQNGRSLTLGDLIQTDAQMEQMNEEIRQQIAAREQADENQIYFHDEWGFKTISPEQPFFINKNGNIVIYFEKYAIAPGYMGEQTFVMPKTIVSLKMN
ncbi:MAG: DUF3298 domain-containing protein [Bacilli bacterium]